MAYWIDESAKVGSGRQVTFFCDSDNDISNLPTSSASGVKQDTDDVSCLPCGKGSKALAIESGKIYILNSSDSWTEIGGGE